MMYVYKNKDLNIEDTVFFVDNLFNAYFNIEWLQDPFIQEMIKDVDKTEVIQDELLKSSVLGYIAPSRLSTGVKGLILLAKCEDLDDRYYLSSKYGKNCFKWVFKISTLKNFKIVVNSLFFPTEDCDKTLSYQINFVDSNYIATDLKDAWDKMFGM